MEKTIIVMIFLSLVLIGISIFLMKKEEKEREKLNIRLDEAFTSINTALDSFESQSNDFNSTCEMIFREIEEKYQELLLLYGLIEEQKNNQENNDSEKSSEKPSEKSSKPKQKKKEAEKKNAKKVDNSFIYKNKNATEIFKLYDEGMSINDIAKKLSIGKGEVQLMINIRKA